MMRTPIFIDSPCAIYGQAEALKLSEEQKEKLIEIENEARKKAMDVLTDEQKKKMGDIPNKPMAMAQMCQQMCGKMTPMMQKMMGGKGKAGPMMMCPMMQMMGGKGQEGSMTCSQMQKPPKGNDVQAKNSEQVTCPVMGSPINKNFFTEYKDKKVYFCCGGPCKGKFEANPEKYIAKLPQFKELKNGNSK
jgi:YHS domain-containing protein